MITVCIYNVGLAMLAPITILLYSVHTQDNLHGVDFEANRSSKTCTLRQKARVSDQS